MTQRTRTPAWWETPRFTDGPETEWFVRSVFEEACRAGKTIYWRCTPMHCSVEQLDRTLLEGGCRLILEHDDHARTRRRDASQLHRVYVRRTGDGVVIVNRDDDGVRLSVASFEPSLIARLLPSKKPLGPPSTTTRRAPHHRS